MNYSDIDFRREVVNIRNAKGNKDRTLPLPEKLRNMLTGYIRTNRPLTWLIEGWKPGKAVFRYQSAKYIGTKAWQK